MRISYILLLLFFTSTLSAEEKEVMYTKKEALIESQLVLDRLYDTFGKFGIAKPRLEIVNKKRTVAAYYPKNKILKLEFEAYKICKSFGSRSNDALGFIIGHELAHALDEENTKRRRKTSYLKFDMARYAKVETEMKADIAGIFNAHLAGYRTTSILSELLDKIYLSYTTLNSAKHPSKFTRKETVTKVLTKVDELIALYESANYLTAIQEYKLAAAAYEYIRQDYGGKEIYNNLAVMKALAAMNVADINVDIFIYPLELEWESKFKRPRKDRGKLSKAEEEERRILLVDALDYLDNVQNLDPNYFSAKINKICLLSLMNKEQEAIDYFNFEVAPTVEKLNENDKESYRQQAQSALAVAYARLNNSTSKQKAINIWEELQQSANLLIANQAKANLLLLEHKRTGTKNRAGTSSCSKPIDTDRWVDDMNIFRLKLSDRFDLNIEKTIKVAIKEELESVITQYSLRGKRFTLQIVKESLPPLIFDENEDYSNTIHLSNGFFYTCRRDNVIFRYDEKGKLIEWAKYEPFNN